MGYCSIHGEYDDGLLNELLGGVVDCPKCKASEEQEEADREAAEEYREEALRDARERDEREEERAREAEYREEEREQARQDAAEERAERAAEEANERAYRLNNPGDHECPYCMLVSLKRGARRCPKCQHDIGPGDWAAVDEKERIQQLAAEQKRVAEEQARREAERQRQEAERQRKEVEQREAAEAAKRREEQELVKAFELARQRRRSRIASLVTIIILLLGGTVLYFKFRPQPAPPVVELSPAERRESHLRTAADLLRQRQWQAAMGQARQAVAAASQPTVPGAFGTPEEVFVTVLREFANAPVPDAAHADAAGEAARWLAQRKHTEARPLALAALKRATQQADFARMAVAAGTFADVLTQSRAPAKRDDDVIVSMRYYLQVANAWRQSAGIQQASAALALLDSPKWREFRAFDPLAVRGDLERAWRSHPGKPKDPDRIDRTAPAMPVMVALFERLDRPTPLTRGQRGLTLDDGTVTSSVTGPDSGWVRCGITGNRAKQGDGYTIYLYLPSADFGWVIVGIGDVVLEGHPLTLDSLAAERKAREDRVTAALSAGRPLPLSVGDSDAHLSLTRTAGAMSKWEGTLRFDSFGGKPPFDIPVTATLQGDTVTIVSDEVTQRSGRRYVMTLPLKLDRAGTAMKGKSIETVKGVVDSGRSFETTLRLEPVANR